MKLIASYFLYHLGNIISVFMMCDLFSFLYPAYNKIMLKSMELDEHEKIWRKV